jgi:hypothetical protein
MFGSPELYFDLAKLHHRELLDEAARERIASCAAQRRRSRRQGRERQPR